LGDERAEIERIDVVGSAWRRRDREGDFGSADLHRFEG
jgi:hypothetical protein